MRTLLSLLCSVLAASAALASPVRDDLAARGTSSTSDRPHAAFVEYLESTGTQWIDTGITASTEVRPLEIAFAAIPSKTYDANNSYFFGGGDSTSSGYGFILRENKGSLVSVGFGWSKILTLWNRPHIDPYDVVTQAWYFQLNGYGYNTLSFHETYSCTFALFGRNIGGIVTPCPVRIYFAKIGELDLLPVRIGNEGFMLDTVSGELFANQGTGSFILGPDIAPLEY